MRRELSGWGRTVPSAAEVVLPVTREELAASVAADAERGVLARGLGRSYGDAAQNAGGTVVDTAMVDSVVALDEDGGTLVASAGAHIDGLLRALVPRGWFVPVTPGTRHVTVGGAVASDIHGKNHHQVGSWCSHVREMTLATPALGTVTVGPEPSQDPELFWATAGGMGLTGTVVDATISLLPIPSNRLVVDTDRTTDLEGAMTLLEGGDADHPYTVAWVDLLPACGQVGRAVVTRGRFAERSDLSGPDRRDPLAFDPQPLVAVPPVVPSWAMSRSGIQAFNEAWYRRAPRRRRGELQTIGRFFHPLDGVADWNRLYGARGFLQWQCVVPFGQEDALRTVAATLAARRVPTLIGVLKRFGPSNPGPLSFPLAGWTLAVDIPARVAGLGPLLDRLDEVVAGAGGRIYLAKDSRLRPELLPVMYPRLEEWRAVRDRVDPRGVLRSDLGRRLGLC